MITRSAPRPSPAEIQNLNREYQARGRGEQQTQSWQSQRPYFQRPSEGYYNRPSEEYYNRPSEGNFSRPQGIGRGGGGRK